MTDLKDLIAKADRVMAHDPPSAHAAAFLVPALRDALAAALVRAEAAECHAEALEADRDRLRDALTFYATGEWHIGYPGGVLFKGPGDDCPNHIDYGDRARAAMTVEPQP